MTLNELLRHLQSLHGQGYKDAEVLLDLPDKAVKIERVSLLKVPGATNVLIVQKVGDRP